MENKKVDEKGRAWAVGAGMVVYGGVVIVATVLFISFVLTAFDEKQYFSRAIMSIGGVLVGASTLAFPYALHKWAVDGLHRKFGIGLYVGEIAFIALNSIVSFTALLAIQGKVVMPDWMLGYEPYSIISIVYVLAAWAIMFMLDPNHEIEREARSLEQERAKNEAKKERLIAQKEAEFYDSVEGEDYIMKEAEKNISDIMRRSSDSRAKKHFGSGQRAFAADTEKVETKNA